MTEYLDRCNLAHEDKVCALSTGHKGLHEWILQVDISYDDPVD